MAGNYRLHFSGGVSTLGDLSEGPTGHNEIARAKDYFALTGILFLLNPEPRVALRSTLGYHISPRWGFGRLD